MKTDTNYSETNEAETAFANILKYCDQKYRFYDILTQISKFWKSIEVSRDFSLVIRLLFWLKMGRFGFRCVFSGSELQFHIQINSILEIESVMA